MKNGKSKIQKVFDLLKRKKRVYNYELNHIGFRYGARIAELRKKGCVIETYMERTGLYYYEMIFVPKDLSL